MRRAADEILAEIIAQWDKCHNVHPDEWEDAIEVVTPFMCEYAGHIKMTTEKGKQYCQRCGAAEWSPTWL